MEDDESKLLDYLYNLKKRVDYHEFIHRIPVFNLFKHVSSIAALCNSIFILINIATDNDNIKFVFSIIIAVFNILILFSSLMYNIFYNEKLTVLQERTIQNCNNLNKKISFFMESYHTFSNEEKERRIKKIRYDFQDILLSQPPVSEKKIDQYRKKLDRIIENDKDRVRKNIQKKNNNLKNINNNINNNLNNTDISNTSEA